MIGQVVGRWTVLSRAAPEKRRKQVRWLCRCACGTESLVQHTHLIRGLSRSCGCATIERSTRHGHSREHAKTAEYQTWERMVQRCTNPRNKSYANYGGRGISVCPDWRDFSAFLRAVGPRPSAQHSLDRYPDQSGPYAPGNVRWATTREQGQNKRTNRLLTLGEETHCLTEWARRQGLLVATIRHRLTRGWSVADALTVAVRSRSMKP